MNKFNISYIELNSAFRNRSKWPLPTEFETEFKQSSTSQNYEDPISYGYPSRAWSSNFFNVGSLGDTSITGMITEILSAKSFNIQSGGIFHDKIQYYKNAVISNTITNKFSNVKNFSFLNNNKAYFEVNDDLEISIGDTIEVLDSTDFSNPIYFLFVPGNLKINMNDIIFNETTNTWQNISQIDNSIIQFQQNVTWLTTHNYSIRKEPPRYITIGQPGSTESNVIFGPGLSTTDNAYQSWFIRLPPVSYNNAAGNVFSQIMHYNGTTFTASVVPALPFIPTGMKIELLQISGNNSVSLTNVSLFPQNSIFKIRCLRLIIPNIKFNGCLLENYKYLYVEIKQSSEYNSLLLTSNNPYAKKALFTMSSINNVEENLKYIIYNDEGIQQNIRFNLSSSLYLRIFTEDGTTLVNDYQDNFSPQTTNPDFQIRILLEFKLLDVQDVQTLKNMK
jgi:hypothetical protein